SHNKRYSLLFQWLYLTGMRPGEAIALSKDDVHITNNNASVVINGTMMYRERSIADMKKSDSTKTAAGMREIDLPKKAIAIYNELLELNPNGQFLFQTTKGTPFQLTAINTYLRNHKADMKIDKKLSSHIFRHTHISKLAELGTPLYAIQDRVGHENSDITEKIYLHVTKGVKEKLKEDIEKL
ncbi:TPA: site-specific integrase, partial [Enterococcus faecium]|nr:site-specific integrase [Enterococcus faecium]HAP9643256.1 site-specific integrase [Enterococcus faecium]